MEAPFRNPTPDDVQLLEQARHASERAYVPYSTFRVGAALRLADGEVVLGCNVENASYGLTICAERTAFVRIVAEGRDPRTVEAIAISVDGPEGQPCGACRQFMVEFAPDAAVTFVHHGHPVTATAHDLLAGAFVPAALDA